MNPFNTDLIARAIQKNDKTRVALRKSSCGAVMIDGLPFSVSVESDGAENKKGVVFTVSGGAVHDGVLDIPLVEVTYPSSASASKKIIRKPEIHSTREGKKVYRCAFPEIKIPECDDPDLLDPKAMSMEQLAAAGSRQIVFRFTPEYKAGEETEVMINIYPLANPLEGSCTEWVTITSDRDFFEHGGLSRLMDRPKKQRKKK